MISQKNDNLPNWIDNKKISGGGVLLYNAIHSIDKICFILDSKIDYVFAHKANINEKIDVEDIINISLKFKNGILANLIATFLPYFTTPKWETKIFGSSGQIDINIRKGFELISKNKIKKFDYTKYYKKMALIIVLIYKPNHSLSPLILKNIHLLIFMMESIQLKLLKQYTTPLEKIKF